MHQLYDKLNWLLFSAFLKQEQNSNQLYLLIFEGSKANFQLLFYKYQKFFSITIATMISQESTIFPKQIKIDDYEPADEQNLIRIMETSNLLLGNGGRSSIASIVLAKCFHLLQDQNILNFRGKNILQFGSGVGLLGIYLSCIGANVTLTDLPAMKDLAERNINLNREILKGECQYFTLNWKKGRYQQNKGQKQEYKSTSSSDISNTKALQKVDWALACDCGNIQDLQKQLDWIGKQGMIVGFMERQSYLTDEFLSSRQLEKYLLEKQYQYQRIDNYHPDYIDQRVSIYKIWK